MIDKLVQLARKEEVPEIDVSAQIMTKIRARKAVEASDRSWMSMGLVASISSIAASIIVFFAFNSYKEIHDPYASFFKPYTIEMSMDYPYYSQ